MAQLTKKEKLKLLEYAKTTILYKLGLEKQEPEIDINGPHCGAFVTLRKEGNLRGCIGNITSDRPISETIRNMAESAAFNDPRFLPLTLEEVEKITIEISILSPLEIVENPAKIKTGRDGLLVRNGIHSGLLLPQVAVEQEWDNKTFLNQTFIKAGLAPEYINDERTEIFSFTADVFGDDY